MVKNDVEAAARRERELEQEEVLVGACVSVRECV